MSLTITGRGTWGAAPPANTPHRLGSWGSKYLWAHHTVGNYVSPDYGDDASWLRKLSDAIKNPKKYTSQQVSRWKMLKARNDAVRKKTVESECKAMREIQRFHQKTREWNDIGYHFVVFPSGRVYEGRGMLVTGAHCYGHNTEPSLSFAGDYSKREPDRRAITAFGEMIEHLNLNGWRGHRDGYNTSCPGDALFNALRREYPRN
jgi:hypothetical protein